MDKVGKKTQKIVLIDDIDIPENRNLFNSELGIERGVVEEGFQPGQIEITVEKKGNRYKVVTGGAALRGIQRRIAKGLPAPSEIEVILLKKPLYRLLITGIEAHPRRYLVFASLLILLFIFYWIQIRPTNARKACAEHFGVYYTQCLHQYGVEK